MNDPAGPPRAYEFRKSLKDAHRYPVLELFRVERYLTRPLASLIVRAVFRSRIKPDHLTWASFIVALLAAAVFLGGSHPYFAAAGILALLSSVLDCADGMLARARDQCTERGAFLDIFLDRIADFVGGLALAFGTYRFLGSAPLLVWALVGVTLVPLQASLYYILLLYRRDPRMGRQAEVRGFGIFLLAVLCVLNRPHYFIYVLLGEGLVGTAYFFVLFFRPPRP